MSGSELSGLVLYRRATGAVDTLIRQVRDEQWTAMTPCETWSVRDLVNHLTAENRWMPPLLAGRTTQDVGDQLDGDLLGQDPVLAWDAALASARHAATSGHSSSQPVHLASGVATADEYLMQVGADHLLHSWDLAVAIGVDDSWDPDLVAAVTGWFVDREAAYRQAGVIGPRTPVATDAGPQTRLLAMFGRTEPGGDALAAVDRFGAAFDAQDVNAVMAAMTPDCVFESTAPPDGARHQGQDQVRTAWTQFFADSAGASFRTERRFACGDRVVVHWRYDWAGTEPGHVRGVDIFRVEGGLVAEKLSYVKG